MPLPLTSKTFGTVTLRPAMSIRNLPGTLKTEPRSPPWVMAVTAARTSTWMSKVPSSPVSSAVTPLPPWLLPKLNAAVLTPMPTESTSWPSLKPVLTRPTDGPSRDSGPSTMLLVAAAASCTAPDTVNVAVLAALVTALAPVPTFQLPATTCTVTSPSMKVSASNMPAFGWTKKR
jgi:hypothetical protein